jgi:acetyltransferase-like isoleucine patch superfamily enzyme
LIRVGEGAVIDPGALVGYRAERLKERKALELGPRARIRSGSVVYEGSRIGAGLQTGHGVILREENLIGDSFSIWNNSCVDYGCVIGNRVKIHNNVYIAQFTTIEDDVFIAPGVIVTNDPCPPCGLCMKGPTIRRGAKIGGGATLLPHIVIGEDARVGAGAVVTRNVPPRALVVGNPARVLRKVTEMDCFVHLKPRAYPDIVDQE